MGGEVGLEGAGGVAGGGEGYLLGGAGGDDVAAGVATLGAEVDDVVGALDHFEVVFDDNDGVSGLDEVLERLHEGVDVVEMQSCGWLVEDEEGVSASFAAEEVGEFDSLALASAEGA